MFGNEAFGGGAERMLQEILVLIKDKKKTYYVGGYSKYTPIKYISAWETVKSGPEIGLCRRWETAFGKSMTGTGKKIWTAYWNGIREIILRVTI